MAFDLMTPPAWAANWCYVYFAIAIFSASLIVIALVMSIGSAKKQNFLTVAALLVAGILSFIDTMTYFWICRASLAK